MRNQLGAHPFASYLPAVMFAVARYGRIPKTVSGNVEMEKYK